MFLLTVACTSIACSCFRVVVALDSVAEFAIRIKYLGLSEYMDKLDAMGATTFGMFVFAANCSPNSADDSAFIKEIMSPTLDSDTHPKKMALRRLFIEACPMGTAEMQRTADPRSSEVPCQLPTLWRELRRTRLEERLVLTSQATTIFQIGWLISHTPRSSPRRCSICVGSVAPLGVWSWTRSRRTNHGPTLLGVSRDCLSQFWIICPALWCVGRSRLTWQVVTFATSDVWRKMLLTRMREAALPGYAKINVEQALRADEELWLYTANFCRRGVSLWQIQHSTNVSVL